MDLTSTTEEYKKLKENENLPECVLILNQPEYLVHLYRRYSKVRLEAMLEAAHLLNVCSSKSAALHLLRGKIGRLIPKTTDNVEEQNEIYNEIFKRGNPRSKVGL